MIKQRVCAYKPKPCRICASNYIPVSANQRYCGDYAQQTGCSGLIQKLYPVHRAMLIRCGTERGYEQVRVCKEWKSFSVFFSWAMKAGFTHGLFLDRKDVRGNYTPDNCRWTTMLESARNKKNSTTDVITQTRVCCACKERKSLSDFPSNRFMSQKRGYLCVMCSREYNKIKAREYRNIRNQRKNHV